MVLNLTQDGQGYVGTFDIGLEGVPEGDLPSATPVISGAAMTGKQLIVTGQNFDDGAKLFLNGDKQKKTDNDEANPTTVLIARKSGKKIDPGQTVTLQVRNSDGTLSDEFLFTRPVEG